MIITNGTKEYVIPLPAPYGLKRTFPLVIEVDEAYVIECPAFDEYGYGKTYEEAMTDLGSSLVDLWKSLKRRKTEQETLALLNENILEVK